MIVKPKTRGFICTTSHPEGCFKHVRDQIAYVTAKPALNGPKNVLVIGCSTGFGIASRIVSAFSCGANTLGVAFEKAPDDKRTASAGWYNCVEFEKAAKQKGLYSKTLMGDAFSLDMKQKTAQEIKDSMGKIDMLVYSIAAPRRTDHDGNTYSSVLKPIGNEFTSNTVDLKDNSVSQVTIQPANEQEIADTIKVMGGEDWKLWIDFLSEQDLLAEGFTTVAYSYDGPSITHPIYLNGTIGQAKADLKRTSDLINEQLQPLNGRSYISVNKALVTQASSAIPVVPLYISILFKIMKEKGIHEGCIEQMYRLYADFLTVQNPPLDNQGRIRIDDLEMREDVQAEVMKIWDVINTDNIEQSADLKGYWSDFFELFGFGIDGVDYDADVAINVGEF